MNRSMPGLPVHHKLPEFTQTHAYWVSDATQTSHPLSSPSPPGPNPSKNYGLFQWVNSSHEVAKVLEFQLQHQSCPGLISFRMDWLDLLAVQGTIKSLLQYHSSKESIFQCAVFFTVQLSHPYMTTGKTIALTRWTFVDNVMSLLFNMLSTFWTMVLEKTLESPLNCKEIQPVHPKGDQSWMFIGSWSWNYNILATSCEELTHWKKPWCWEGLGAGGEGDDRGWDGWMASTTRWAWVWVNSGSWWRTGRPGMLRFMGSQRVRQDWATELNWGWS